MPNREDYQSKLELITAIPEHAIKSPTMPVDVFLQEAENLHHWCLDDKADLTGAGLDWGIVIDLPVRAGALREAQSIWVKKRFSQADVVKEWQTASRQGYDLRDRLLHSFRYAYRKDANLLGRVSSIADGDGHADMIQDLNDIAVLGQAQIEPLMNINLDPAELQKAATTADRLANLLAKASADRRDNTRIRVIRDQAYTHLKDAVDDVRACGQYVFSRDEARMKGYISYYFKKTKSKNKPSTTSATESVSS